MRKTKMKNDRQIQVNEIIERYSADLYTGAETVDSIIEKYPMYAEELRPRLEALVWLTLSKRNLEPRQGFIASSRAHIEQKAATTPPLHFWERIFKDYTPQHLAFYITTPALIIVLLGLIINSLVFTARLALPGDLLYPAKLLIENTQLALTFNPEKKTVLLLQFTKERSSEFIELVLDGDYQNLPSAATRMETEIVTYARAMSYLKSQGLPIEQVENKQLNETLTNEIALLTILKGSVPPSAYAGIDQAIGVTQTGLMALR